MYDMSHRWRFRWFVLAEMQNLELLINTGKKNFSHDFYLVRFIFFQGFFIVEDFIMFMYIVVSRYAFQQKQERSFILILCCLL